MTAVLASLIVVPLLAGFAVLPLPRQAALASRVMTLGAAGYTVAVAITLLIDPTPRTEVWRLGPTVLWNLPLRSNGLAAALVLLTGVVYVTAVTTSWRRVQKSVAAFHGLLSLLVAGVFGVFLTDHVLYLFVFYELAVLPMYLLIGIWGSTRPIPGAGPFAALYDRFAVGTRAYGAMKLTLVLLVGSAALLVGIFVWFAAHEQIVGVASFMLDDLRTTPLSASTRSLLFLLFYFGFGSLAGIWPFHTWSPDGHAAAPPAASMMHAGVLMKLGAYGVLRVGMVALPSAGTDWAWLVGGIAVVNILYGALAALWQTDIKYLIAYSSVSHMGVVMLGIATGNSTGWTGAVLQMVAHGWMTALLFTLVGIIYDETHERRIEKLHGLGRRMPRLAAAWMLASLSSLGLPGLGGFVAELYTFTGAWQKNALWAIAGAFGAWITAVYLLRVARAIIFAGEADCGHDITGFDRVTPWVLGGALLLMGLWPRFLIDGIEPQVRLWLAGAGLLP